MSKAKIRKLIYLSNKLAAGSAINCTRRVM